MKHFLSRINIYSKDKSKAFTLFVSLLVASLLLAIGFSIGNILIKQLVLTQTGSGTQIAFYAADSAAECALYWDRKDAQGMTITESPFGTSSSQQPICGSGAPADGGGKVYGFSKRCNDNLCGVLATAATSTFFVDFRDPKDLRYRACAQVTVFKKFNTATGEEETVIDARGYNTDLIVDQAPGYTYGSIISSARCNLERARTVERGLYLTY